ncbi:MAG: SOS response-associated peptidase family protein, partial [Acidimicrobiales bacterium]
MPELVRIWEDASCELHRMVVGPIDNNVYVLRCRRSGEALLVAIRSEDGKRVPRMMRWGLLPHWAKDEKLSYSTFNARA